MNKKMKRSVAGSAVACLVMTAMPVIPAFAADYAGSSRIDTAIKIAEASWNGAWKGETTAVLAAGNNENLVDALAVAPLAYAKKAPILLSRESKDAVDAATLTELKTRGVKTVYLAAGTGVLTEKVEAQLKDAGVTTVVRLGGANRYETSKNIAKALGSYTKVALVNGETGLADALSIASIAANQGMAIALTNGTDAPEGIDLAGKTVYAIGGGVSDALVSSTGAKKLAGSGRLETNAAVISEFKATEKFDTVYVADGRTLVDALAGSVLAAQTASPIVLADSNMISDAQSTVLKGAMTTKSVTEAFGGSVATAQNTVKGIANPTTTPAGELKVNSVSAISASAIKVTFAAPVADTTKAVFAVKRSATPATVTVTWNDAKTEATLTSASKFAEATFTVGVVYDAKDLGSKEVSFTAQKVAKIEFTSPSVAVTVSNNPKGYVTYKVYDQYNNDITTTAMANTLSAQAGVDVSGDGSVNIKNGVMTITPKTGINLMTYQAISVVLFDSGAGVTSTKSLPVSTVTGTLTDFAFGSTDGIKLVEGDTTTVFYVPFTAKDMSGNETKSYELISGGLIDASGTGDVDLVTSLSDVSAKIVKDPANNKNAAVELRFTGSNTNYTMDMPLTVTAMTYNGKTTSIQTTVAKAKAVDKLTLLAPAEVVAAGDTGVEIPFEALDAAGNPIKGYSDVKKINLNGGNNIHVVEKANGDAKIVFDAPASKNTITFSATTPSSKMSNMLSLNVQDAAHPASLAFDQTGIVGAMETGATQRIEIGPDLKVYDQYDRVLKDSKIDSYFASGNYEIVATTTGNAKVRLKSEGIGNGHTSLDIHQSDRLDGDRVYVDVVNVAGGSGSVVFDLKEILHSVDNSGNPVTTLKSLDTASTSLSVIATDDVDSYAIATTSKPIYTVGDRDHNRTLTAGYGDLGEYDFEAKVYGATKAGTKVLLAGNVVSGATLSNNDDFDTTTASAISMLPYDGVLVNATGLDNNRTTASTDVVVTVKHNNTVKALKTTITSSTTAPTATDIVFYGDLIDDDGVVDVTAATANTWNAGGVGDVNLQEYGVGAGDDRKFYAAITDSYGTEGMQFTSFYIAKQVDASGAAISVASIAGDKLSVAGTVAGDEIYITGVTNNGLTATMKIVVK